MTHVGLVKIINNQITKVQYVESKFDRELGDTLTIDGERMRVGVIGEDRNSVITTLNGFIKTQNSIIRKQQRVIDAKANKTFNKIMKGAIKEALDF